MTRRKRYPTPFPGPSLHYLSLDGILGCVIKPADHYCTACFSGEHRINVDNPVNKLDLEKYQLRMFN